MDKLVMIMLQQLTCQGGGVGEVGEVTCVHVRMRICCPKKVLKMTLIVILSNFFYPIIWQ